MADALGLSVNIIAVVDLFIKIGVQCSIYCSGVRDAPRDIRQILNEADKTTATLEDLKRLLASPIGARLSSSQRILRSVGDARLQLQDIAVKLEGELRTGTGASLQRLRWPLKKEEVAGIISQLQKCRASIALDLQVDQTALLLNVHQEAVLAKLKSAKGAAFDSPSHANSSRCYPGTREAILEQIKAWSTRSDGQCIFWLNGGAGTGKSTISRTVAQWFVDKKMLGASFFFKHGEADRGNMALFFPTIASQLVQTFPQTAPHVRAAVEADPTIYDRSIKEQFDKLIADPIKMTSEASKLPTIVVVADALDECDNDEHVRLVIHLLSQTKHFTSASLKFFVTSRPELAIRLGFADICGKYEDLILHQVPRVAIEHDITLFLEHEMAMIRHDYNKSVSGNRQLPPSWPGNDKFQQLVSRSVPLFIFAATACRFIQDRRIGGPKEQLAKILEQQTGHGSISNLDATYLPIVNGLVAGLSDAEKGFVSERSRRIVGSIVTLASPLCAPSLARLLDIPLETLEDQLDLLHSVLYIPPDARQPVRILHLSFRDFLVDPAKANEADRHPLWIDERKAHEILATRCLELLLEEGTLKKNICDLKLPSTPRSGVDQSTLETTLPSEVQYACLYWVFHWKESMDKIEDGGLVDRFLNKHLLHWLEALGLIGRTAEAIGMVNDLMSFVHPEKGVFMSLFLRDVRRIILSSRAIIDISPLQIYYSAIVFAPEQSIVRARFQSELPPWLTISPPAASRWDACLQTLEGHGTFVSSVAFSHDSKMLASASWGGTAKIWDVASGICISTLREAISKPQFSHVAFSHDSKFLASTTPNNDIELWGAVTGTCDKILKGHHSVIKSVAFSHESRILAAAFQDCTIKLWDTISGICTFTLNGHSKSVDSIAFSQDSTTLVSASADSSIRFWDVATGDCKTTIDVNDDAFWTTAFSHDCRILASASSPDSNCIRLWDTTNGGCKSTLKLHGDRVISVCFSHDSKMLASASGESDVRLWDVATSTSIAVFKGHAGGVLGFIFSHDSRLLATASTDNTIKVWDIEAGVGQIPLSTVNDSLIGGIKLVKGTNTLITESKDELIQLWDVPTASRIATLTGCSAWPFSIAVAPNSEMLASTSIANDRIQLWNVMTGAEIATIEGDNSPVLSDESWRDDASNPLMSERGGCRYIQVWSPNENKYSQYGGWYSVISAITISHDSRLLASASAVDGIIKVWDVGSGDCIATLTGHSNWVNYLAFLPQSDVLVSSSGDRTIRIWEICTASCSETLEGQSEPYTEAIALSHDYNMLASGKDDGSIEIWDVSKRDLQIRFRGASQNPVHILAFSRCSALLASVASRERDEEHFYKSHYTLEFWNVSTGQCLTTVDIHFLALHCISFDEAGPCLSTSVGKFTLNGSRTGAMLSDGVVGNSLSLSSGNFYICRQGIGLSEDSEWVMWNGDRMIWLPPAYRPSGSAVIDSTLAIGCSQPHPVFLKISPDLIQLEYQNLTDVYM